MGEHQLKLSKLPRAHSEDYQDNVNILLNFITIIVIKGKRSQELKACYIISSEFCAVNKKEQENTVLVFFSLLR